MLIKLKKNKSNNLLAILSLIVVALLFSMNQSTSIFNSPINQTITTKAASPCPHSKTSQTQSNRPCQPENQGFKFDSILPTFFIFFDSAMGKMFFIFVLGLLAASHRLRIYKPPKKVLI